MYNIRLFYQIIKGILKLVKIIRLFGRESINTN